MILDDRRTAGILHRFIVSVVPCSKTGFGALAPHFVHCRSQLFMSDYGSWKNTRSELGLTKEDVQLALEILQLPRAAVVPW